MHLRTLRRCGCLFIPVGIAETPPFDRALERGATPRAGQKEGVTARDKLRDGVEAALLSLGQRLHVAPQQFGALREKLHSGALPLPEFFSQLLRLVHRLIFLLAAEDRNRRIRRIRRPSLGGLYAEGYSVGALRRCSAPRGMGPTPRPLGRAARHVHRARPR